MLSCRAYALAATDANGRAFEFVIKSWANGTEHRRVYVLEQAAPFIRAHRLAPGDAVGLCSDAGGDLSILANTPEVRPRWQRTRAGLSRWCVIDETHAEVWDHSRYSLPQQIAEVPTA